MSSSTETDTTVSEERTEEEEASMSRSIGSRIEQQEIMTENTEEQQQDGRSNDDIVANTTDEGDSSSSSIDMEKAAIQNEWNPPIVAATLIPEPTTTATLVSVPVSAASPAPPATTRGDSFRTTCSSPNLPSSIPSSTRDLSDHPDLEIATIEVDGGFTSLEEELNHAALHGGPADRSDTTWTTDDDMSSSDGRTSTTLRSKWNRKLKKRKRWMKAATLMVAMLLCVAIGAVLATKYAEKSHGGSKQGGNPVDDPMNPVGLQAAPSAAPSDNELHRDCITEAVPMWTDSLGDVKVKSMQVSQDGLLMVILTQELQLRAYGNGFDGESILTQTNLTVRDFSLSLDGTTVGVAVDTPIGGELLMFRVQDKAWVPVTSLATGGGSDGVIYNVDVSKDGNDVAFCSSPDFGVTASYCWVYKLDNGDEFVKKGNNGPLDNFGDERSTIELSDEGNRVFLATSKGMVRAFDLVDGEWTQAGSALAAITFAAAGHLAAASSSEPPPLAPPVAMATSSVGDVVAVGTGASATVYGYINEGWHQVGFASLNLNTTNTASSNSTNTSTTNSQPLEQELVLSLTPEGTSLLLTVTVEQQEQSSDEDQQYLVHEALMFRRTVADVVFSHPLSIELPTTPAAPTVRDVQLIEGGNGLVVAVSDALIRYDLECMRRLSLGGD